MSSLWVARFLQSDAERARDDAASFVLYCFPGSGGSAADFRGAWPAAAGSRALVRGMAPPGRMQRYREPPVSDIRSAARSAALEIASLHERDRRPFALYGYSLGSLLAYEAAAELGRLGRPPVAIAVAGRAAPHVASTVPPLSRMICSDEQFIFAVADRYGDERLRSPELRDLLVETAPALRAEIAAVESYTCEDPRETGCCKPVVAPILVLAGDTERVTDDALRAWALHTSAECPEPVRMPGGHTFARERAGEVAEAVSRFVARTLEAVTSPGPRVIKAQCMPMDDELLCF